MKIYLISVLCLIVGLTTATAQHNPTTKNPTSGLKQETAVSRLPVEDAVQIGLKNNTLIQSAQYDLNAQESQEDATGDIGKTTVTGMFGQYNSYAKGDNNFTITQSIPFPTVFRARASLAKANVRSSELKLALTENELASQIKSSWYHLAYLHELNRWYLQSDSLWREFSRAAIARHRAGETNLLEKVTAEGRYAQVQAQLKQNESDIIIFRKRLQMLLAASTEIDVQLDSLIPKKSPQGDTAMVINSPELQWSRQQIDVAKKETRLEKNSLAPDLLVGYFNQTLIGVPLEESGTAIATSGNRFQGFQVGLSFPLWFRPQTAKVKASEFNRLSMESKYEQELRNYGGEFTSLGEEVNKLSSSLSYYTDSALPQAQLILRQSSLAFRAGEIGYVEYIQALNTAADLRVGYLGILNQYNQAVINLEYLLGVK